jgi:aspartate/tyrosine/aromatic aminotransferase
MAAHTGRRLETFPMFTPSGSFHLAAFEKGLAETLARQGRALVFLNTPCHNPTGFSLDGREWASVVEIVGAAASKAPVSVLFDLAYSRFAAPSSFAWQAEALRLADKAVLLFAWTASKSFAQYGARVGALVAAAADAAERGAIANALGFACRGTWSNCNHLGMLAVTELLMDPSLRKRSDNERELLRHLLQERVDAFKTQAHRRGLAFPRYEGGFFVAVFTPDAKKTSEHMKKLGVFVVPLQGAVRVALCSTPASRISRLVDALAAGVHEAGG